MRRNAVLAVLLAAVLAVCLFWPGDSAAAVQNYGKRWSIKPPVGSSIYWSSLAQGLSSVYVMNAGGGNPINLVRRVASTGNALTWAAGKNGTSLSFNGTSSYVRETSHALSNVAFGVTMMVYAYSANWAQGGGLISKGADGTNYEMFLYTTPNGAVYLRGADAGTSAVLSNTTTTGPLQPGWHQVVGTAIGAVGNFYIDGIFRGTGTIHVPEDSSGDLWIGTVNNNFYWFTGKIECAYVWNRVLQADEIMQLYIDPYAIIQSQSPAREQYVGFSAGAGTGLTRNHSIIMVGP